MKSYYWLLATLLLLSFDMFHLIFESIQNLEYHYKTENKSVSFIEKNIISLIINDTIPGLILESNKIQKLSLLSRNIPSMANYDSCSKVGNGLFIRF